ncbi:3'-5' exonuclease domain protein [Mucinivorans hirudinis]|uniref:3'-5' exonuclease domain protein n=1 Tax=Mucinivorans hirudinis TaxID=1433126 RepID=A0A060R5V6_9BACT|nr:3'-5' exonuclease domain protein [Mucinivorans hirudinis]
MFQPTITNEEVNALPVVKFAGRIIVVDSEESLAEAERVLEGEQILGFDTETRPSFQKGFSYRMSLLQLSTGDTAVLLRLNLVEISPVIKNIVQSASVIKVGAAIRDDIKGLQKLKRFKPAGFVDLQSIVGRYGIEELSVRKMAAIVLGVKVSKAQRLSNWEAQNLTAAQQDYAAVDAWVCREIYNNLIK